LRSARVRPELCLRASFDLATFSRCSRTCSCLTDVVPCPS
jgi:hypothetical protein